MIYDFLKTSGHSLIELAKRKVAFQLIELDRLFLIHLIWIPRIMNAYALVFYLAFIKCQLHLRLANKWYTSFTSLGGLPPPKYCDGHSCGRFGPKWVNGLKVWLCLLPWLYILWFYIATQSYTNPPLCCYEHLFEREVTPNLLGPYVPAMIVFFCNLHDENKMLVSCLFICNGWHKVHSTLLSKQGPFSWFRRGQKH